MAPAVSIGVKKYSDVLKKDLLGSCQYLQNRGLHVELSESTAGKLTFFSLRLKHGARLEQLKSFLADLLAETIMQHWEYLLLSDIIREQFYYFTAEEKQVILRQALQYINHGQGESEGYRLYRLRRKELILSRLQEYLQSNDDLVLDGFIRFRLKEYVSELKEAADKAVDDFLLEKEYNEFVQLLRYFVEMQEPRVSLVHVLIMPNGAFKLYDRHYRNINSEFLEGLMVELTSSEISYEDLLISALVSLAPEQIVFHTGRREVPSYLLETMKSVFWQRVGQCTGCQFCTPPEKE
ncbi:putative sporulation protein YtxC [Desulfurispora thermophila]|uniref:putative sporulation protein YtxC n=1 Tax=Desulfurispora thermophila TaxID=265470 RepID=UPI00036C3D26|nr:putative sporulation protein YtxC [Desulfurispora thermophila]